VLLCYIFFVDVDVVWQFTQYVVPCRSPPIHHIRWFHHCCSHTEKHSLRSNVSHFDSPEAHVLKNLWFSSSRSEDQDLHRIGLCVDKLHLSLRRLNHSCWTRTFAVCMFCDRFWWDEPRLIVFGVAAYLSYILTNLMGLKACIIIKYR